MIKRIFFRSFVPFMCGITVCMNLMHLTTYNQNYDAQWWKILMATVTAFGARLVFEDNT